MLDDAAGEAPQVVERVAVPELGRAAGGKVRPGRHAGSSSCSPAAGGPTSSNVSPTGQETE